MVNIGTAYKLLTFLATIARWLQKKLEAKPVSARGLKFYQDRTVLERESTLFERYTKLNTIDVICIPGTSILNCITTGSNKVDRLILPNPNCDSLAYFDNSYEPKFQLKSFIETNTKRAKEHHVDIRWSPEFIGYSILIADKHEYDAWVHIEYVLPYSDPQKRPSITIFKKNHPGVFAHFLNAFDKIWDKLKPPGN